MGGLLDPGMERAPGPEKLETPEQREAIQYITNLLRGGAPDIPTQEIAPMTEIERISQENLRRLVTGGEMPRGYEMGMTELERTMGGEYDPRTSQLYLGLRQALEEEKAAGVSDIRRRSQLGGMLYSGPSQRTEAEYTRGMAGQKMSLLGGMYERERERRLGAVPQALQYGQFEAQQPYRQMAAVQQYGALPREIAGAQMGARYQQQMQQTMFPYDIGGQLAQTLSQYSPYYQPQYYQTPSRWSQIMEPLKDIFGLAKAGAETYTAGGFAGAGGVT